MPGASPLRKFLAGAIAGAFGAFTGNPFNVLKLKLMAKKDGKARVKDLTKEIWDNQGLNGFYVGFQSSVLRAMVINASQMGVYDLSKSWMISTFALEGLTLQFFASLLSGFFICFNSAPIDMVQVKLTTQSTVKEE